MTAALLDSRLRYQSMRNVRAGMFPTQCQYLKKESQMFGINRRICSGLLVTCIAFAAQSAAWANDQDTKIAKQMTDEKVTLVRAIQAAEASTKGKAVHASVRMNGNDLDIRVQCLVGDKCMEVPYNPKTSKTGTPVAATTKNKKTDLNARAKDLVKQMTDAKMTLVSAIEAAHKHGNGTVIFANAQRNDGKLSFAVRCVEGDKLQNLVVDGKTGKVEGQSDMAHAGDKSPQKPATKRVTHKQH